MPPGMASQGPNEADWELYQDALRELYLTENETLKTVMTIMANNHGFHATYYSGWALALYNMLILS